MRTASVLAPRSVRKQSSGPGTAPIEFWTKCRRSASSSSFVIDGAADRVGVAADVLRRRVHDDVGAERERLLQVRARERVVDDDERAGRVRALGDRGDVDDLEQRVGRRLEPDQVGRPLERLARDALVRQVDELVVVALRGVELREQPVGAAVDVVDRDRARAGREQLHDRGRRAHAGREADAVLAALERGQARLERRARRVDRARVVVAAAHLQHAVLRVGAGLVDRHVDRARQRVGLLPGVDRARLKLHSGSRSSRARAHGRAARAPRAARAAVGRLCQCTARARSVPALRSALMSIRPTTSGPSSSGST